MMRRHLGYTPAEVDAMSWAELRMWAEGLVDEFAEDDSEAPDSTPDRPPRHLEAVPDSLNDLAEAGISVRRVTVG